MKNAVIFVLGMSAAPAIITGGHYAFGPWIALGLLCFAFGTLAVIAWGDG